MTPGTCSLNISASNLVAMPSTLLGGAMALLGEVSKRGLGGLYSLDGLEGLESLDGLDGLEGLSC